MEYKFIDSLLYSGFLMNYSSPGFNIRAPGARPTREGLPTKKDAEAKTKQKLILGHM